MTDTDCTIDTSSGEINDHLDGGTCLTDELESLLELSKKLKRTVTCLVTVKYDFHEDTLSEDN